MGEYWRGEDAQFGDQVKSLKKKQLHEIFSRRRERERGTMGERVFYAGPGCRFVKPREGLLYNSMGRSILRPLDIYFKFSGC